MLYKLNVLSYVGRMVYTKYYYNFHQFYYLIRTPSGLKNYIFDKYSQVQNIRYLFESSHPCLCFSITVKDSIQSNSSTSQLDLHSRVNYRRRLIQWEEHFWLMLSSSVERVCLIRKTSLVGNLFWIVNRACEVVSNTQLIVSIVTCDLCMRQLNIKIRPVNFSEWPSSFKRNLYVYIPSCFIIYSEISHIFLYKNLLFRVFDLMVIFFELMGIVSI